MLMLLWNVSAAIHGYMRSYMPTNIAIDLLCTPRGIKWAIPAALVAGPRPLWGDGDQRPSRSAQDSAGSTCW